ncbi:MAG: lipid-binding SYLF domain-containing protein [Planctomycetota bacterium]
MQSISTRALLGLLLATLVASGSTRSAVAQLQIESGAQEVQTVVGARNALDQFFVIPMESVPPSMLAAAEGIAIFPNMIKGGFILGVNYGKGVLVVRNADRTWSAPVMVTMGGGSVGFQVGVQSADIVLVFATPRSLTGILTGQKVTLGADASIAVGPVGRTANAGTDVKLGAEIYSYARSRGLFLGVSLGGADISVDHNADSMLYGRFGVTPTDVFQGRGLSMHREVLDLIDDLNNKSRPVVGPPAAAIRLSAVPTPTAFPTIAPATIPIVPIGSPPLAPLTPLKPTPLSPEMINPPLVPIR